MVFNLLLLMPFLMYL